MQSLNSIPARRVESDDTQLIPARVGKSVAIKTVWAILGNIRVCCDLAASLDSHDEHWGWGPVFASHRLEPCRLQAMSQRCQSRVLGNLHFILREKWTAVREE